MRIANHRTALGYLDSERSHYVGGMKALLLVASLVFCFQAYSQTYVTVEGAMAWQSQNDQRIPGKGGTDFSFSDLDTGPFPAYRVYLGHIWNERHEIRGLYAPLEVDLDGRFAEPVQFQGLTYAPGVATDGTYKFNSYRLTYAYHFPSSSNWKFALGFTGKIRDAKVSLKQGTTRASKSNTGFVPLLNFQAVYEIAESWRFRFDVDGMAASQGRAIDAALFLEGDLPWPSVSAFGGYRTVEGGADNDEVYNFAWIHYATLGLRGSF